MCALNNIRVKHFSVKNGSTNYMIFFQNLKYFPHRKYDYCIILGLISESQNLRNNPISQYLTTFDG